ncbi:glycosyltransferase [Tessaracoccus sp. OS52]|uniref:glycosyltransferase n=1 Tax=Tessaracoccus sp. OS52 TaxID=2886691 RepID=UPI001D11962F|nr:glycosyltransferase [Tessaracoccus sp. OS52]MCC2594020.1 glycosyltransferase [Tessaracoccus sp. OS52]
MTLRVAFVSMHTSPAERPGTADAGGMNVLIHALADAMGQLDVHVEFITRRGGPDQPDVVDFAEGVVLRHVTAGPTKPLPKSEIHHHIDEFRAGMSELGPFDLIHSHHWMSGVAAIPLAREWGIPHVMTFHSVAAHPNSSLRDGEPPETPDRLAGEVLCAEQSDLVIAVSHHEAAVVIGRCNADPERVAIVRPGVDVDLFHPVGDSDPQGWTPEPGVRPGYLVFAARLQPLKGPDVALRALAGVPAEIRPDLVIIGQTSADFAGYEAELHQLVDDLGLTGNVVFLPGQDRESLAQIIRHASVMLVPSHSETFGLIALEASASGVPVLAAAAGGLTEAICNTHTGILVPGHDAADWSRELTALLRDDERRAALGATGRRRALDMTWSTVAERTLAAYHRVLRAH